MDEQKENQDSSSVDSGESQSDAGVNIQVNTPDASSSTTGPIINDIQPPQQPEAVIEEQDVAAVDSAVKEISDDPTEVSEEQPAKEESVAEKTAEETQVDGSDNIEEPMVKEAPEAPESTETEPQAEEVLQSDPNPFAQKPEENMAPVATPTTPQSMSNNEQSLPHEHRNNKKFAIIVTVVVAILLAGAAAYVYLSAQGNTAETTTKTTVDPNAQNIAEVTPATTLDVDTTLTEIDQTIQSIDDEADLSEAAISDTALGL